MGVTIDGPRAMRILPTARVDIDQIPQQPNNLDLWRKEGGVLSNKVFVRSIEGERSSSFVGSEYISSAGFRLDIWTDRTQEKIFHFHESLGPALVHADRQILNCVLDAYESQGGKMDDAIPKASFCPSKGVEYGTPDNPLFRLMPNGDTALPRVRAEEDVCQDGTWQGDSKYPFRLNYDSPPYYFEQAIMTGDLSITGRPLQDVKVIVGLYLSTLNIDRIKGEIATIIRENRIKERAMREVFNPYVRLEVSPKQ